MAKDKPKKSKEEEWEDYDEEEEESKGPEQHVDPNNTVLYDIMGLKKDATMEEIKKAYKKLALLKHPDKNPNDQQAAENFQLLQKAYKILSDPKKRERYDQWGDDGTDTFNSNEWMNAYEYYRSMHPEITKDDFQSYITKYRHSETEKSDLIKFYED